MQQPSTETNIDSFGWTPTSWFDKFIVLIKQSSKTDLIDVSLFIFWSNI